MRRLFQRLACACGWHDYHPCFYNAFYDQCGDCGKRRRISGGYR